MKRFHCFRCEKTVGAGQVTEDHYGDRSDYFCHGCGHTVNEIFTPKRLEHCPDPRETRITQSITLIVSEKVAGKPLEYPDIPF